MKWSLEPGDEAEKRQCTGDRGNSEPDNIPNNAPEVKSTLEKCAEGLQPKKSFAESKNLRAQLFTMRVDESNTKYATCNKCAKVVKMSNGNTTGLKRHLDRDHPEQYAEIYGAGTTKKAKKVRCGFSQDVFENKIIDWAAKKYLPFSFFDDESTQDLFSYINANVVVPKRDRFRSKTLQRFEKMQNIVMQMLQQNSSKISFTVDGWTSVANKSYYGITGHFIDEQWNIQSLVIDFVPSNGAHSGRDIAKLFYETLKQHGLLEKVQGITLDNASANTVFLAQLEPLMAADNIEFDPKNQHFRCFAHVINLAVNDMIRVIQADSGKVNETDDDGEDEEREEELGESVDCTRVLTKLKTLFKKVKYSEQLTKKLTLCCETTDTKMLSPNLGVATRWNSTCEMLLTAIQMKAALNMLCETNAALRNYRPSEIEWSLLQELVQYLRHFKALSNAFSGEKYATLPLVVIGMNMIIDKPETFILSYQESPASNVVHDAIHEGAIAARDKLIKHYAKTNWVYCIVLILDPRHKIETFQRTTWGTEMAKESIKQFENIYRKRYYDPKMQSEANSCSADAEVTERFDGNCGIEGDDLLDLESLFESSSSGRNRGSGCRKELDNYLALPRADRSENILEWWRVHEKNFPTLAAMEKDFLCIQATSVSVERFFSKASLVLRKHRNRLNNESARSLLCLNSWLTCSLSTQILQWMATKI